MWQLKRGKVIHWESRWLLAASIRNESFVMITCQYFKKKEVTQWLKNTNIHQLWMKIILRTLKITFPKFSNTLKQKTTKQKPKENNRWRAPSTTYTLFGFFLSFTSFCSKSRYSSDYSMVTNETVCSSESCCSYLYNHQRRDVGKQTFLTLWR